MVRHSSNHFQVMILVDERFTFRKVLLSLRCWTIVFILGALVTLLKLRYEAEEIVTILKWHPVSMKTFISVLFLDLVALYASHKPSMCHPHSTWDKIGFLLDALLGIILLLAIDQFLGWLFFVAWSLLVIAMANKLYNHYQQSLESLCAWILRRLPLSHNLMARHSSGHVYQDEKMWSENNNN